MIAHAYVWADKSSVDRTGSSSTWHSQTHKQAHCHQYTQNVSQEFWRQRVVTQTCFCQLEWWPKKWEDFAWLLSTQYITDRFLITVASYLVCQNTKRGKLLHNSIHVLSVEIMCKMHKRQHDWSEHFCFKIYCLDLWVVQYISRLPPAYVYELLIHHRDAPVVNGLKTKMCDMSCAGN